MDKPLKFVGYDEESCGGRVIFKHGNRTVITACGVFNRNGDWCPCYPPAGWSQENIDWGCIPLNLSDKEKDMFVEMVKLHLDARFKSCSCCSDTKSHYYPDEVFPPPLDENGRLRMGERGIVLPLL